MTINCKGNLINLNTPKVMGILNLTPDSFYDGGNYLAEQKILKQVEKMLEDGATFIDVGGQSSRPNATRIAAEEELQRVVSPIQSILREFPDALISIDTFYAKVAQEAIDSGAVLINDISAGTIDESMFKTVGKLNVPYVLMHILGTPETMQNQPQYKDVIKDIIFFLSQKIGELRTLGVKDILVDPGFGFGKSMADNYTILKHLDLFSVLEVPTLVGVSRKSMIYKLLNSSPQEALNGTTIANTIALNNGAKILRVHDVKEAVQCIQINEYLKKM